MESKIVKGTDTSLDALFKLFSAMDSVEIEAGYLEPKPHPDSELNMVQIATLQQFGSTGHKIPERPFITDGAVLSVEEINKHWHNVLRDYLVGKKGLAAFEPVAKASRESIAKAIALQKFVPLSPTTIAIRRQKGNQNTTILVDTGHLINGIESKVSKRRKK